MNTDDNKTIDYYNKQSKSYSSDTLDLGFTAVQDSFTKYLKKGALILDFGCGSGRDTRYFLNQGYRVEAIDGSEEMVKIASHNTGIQVKQMLFIELDETEKYDGIFACASILHVPYEELPSIFSKMKKALRKDGVIYVSFKYGDFEGYRQNRYYTDLNEKRLNTILSIVGGLTIKEWSISSSVMKDRDEKWLNAIITRI